jgi:hypothetical protein
MTSFAESVILHATPEAAFAYLGDPRTATTVDPAVISYDSDTDPMGVGAVNHVRFRAWGLRMSVTTRVLAWDVGRLMVIETIRPARPFVATATHQFEPHPQGTRYTWSMTFRSTAPGGRIAAWFASRFMRRAARIQQARFSQLMEDAEPQLL